MNKTPQRPLRLLRKVRGSLTVSLITSPSSTDRYAEIDKVTVRYLIRAITRYLNKNTR